MGRPFQLLAVLLCLYCPSVYAQSDSQRAIAYINRGWQYGEQGDFQSAIQEFNQAIQLWPYRDVGSDAYFGRGLAYEELGQLTRALSDYDLALIANPNNMDARQKYEELLREGVRLQPSENSVGQLRDETKKTGENCRIITGMMC
jgi:tetratricopeptide (TPR) repeat protein